MTKKVPLKTLRDIDGICVGMVLIPFAGDDIEIYFIERYYDTWYHLLVLGFTQGESDDSRHMKCVKISNTPDGVVSLTHLNVCRNRFCSFIVFDPDDGNVD